MNNNSLSYYLGEIEAARKKGGNLMAKRQGESALKRLDALAASPEEKYNFYCALSFLYTDLAEYSRSIDCIYKAYLIALRHKLRPADIAYASMMMASNLLMTRNIDQTLVQLHKVREYYRQHGETTRPMNRQRYSTLLINLAYCHLYKGELDQADRILNGQLTDYRDSLAQYPLCAVDYHHCRGEYLTELKEYPKARQAFEECVSISQQAAFPVGKLEAHIHLAQLLLLDRQVPEAIELLRSLYQEAGGLKSNSLMCEAGLLLSKCYSLSDQPDKSASIENRIKPLLNKLDTNWLYERIREFDRLYRQLSAKPTGSGGPALYKSPEHRPPEGEVSPKADSDREHPLSEAMVGNSARPKTRSRQRRTETGSTHWSGPNTPKAAHREAPERNEYVPKVLVNITDERNRANPDKYIIVGKSPALQDVYQVVDKIAPTDLPILVQGETGTGKELICRLIHQKSLRAEKPYLAINCGAMPENLLENELFGHIKGAFTGALEDKKGYIELASGPPDGRAGGTLMLDEITNMSIGMQQKLLRVLEEQQVWPLGAEKSVPVDTRFIFASNQNVEQMMSKGLLRSDLFFRINTIIITLPSLRERQEDIPLLVEHFLGKYAAGMRNAELGMGNEKLRISDSTLRILMDYPWPGNVRELENEVQKICILHPVRGSGAIAPRKSERPIPGLPEDNANENVLDKVSFTSNGVNNDVKVIDESMLPEHIRDGQVVGSREKLLKQSGRITMVEMEKEFIGATLKSCQGNITRAAEQMG